MATVASNTYRAPMFHPGDDLFQRCLLGSTVFGVLLLIVIFITPIAQQAIQSVDTEPVMAHLVVPKPPPVVTPVPVAPPAPVGTVGPGEDLHAKPGPRGGEGGRGGHSGKPVANPHPAGGGPSPSPVAGGGEIGRARAAQVAASLSGSTAALSQALSGLSSSLKSTSAHGASTAVPPVVRVVSSGRSDVQLSSILSSVQGASSAGRTGSADVRGSAVQSSLVSIGSLSAVGGGGGTGTGWGTGSGSGTGNGGGDGGTGSGWGGGNGDGTGSGGGTGGGTGSGGGGGGGGGGRGAAPGVYRSNASLMAVVQKYAAGIQFCYGNELKRHEGLKGKLVVAITVAASGVVTQATVVQNTLGATALTSCALSQIRDWKFPAIAAGVTTFQVPFVFTPPN